MLSKHNLVLFLDGEGGGSPQINAKLLNQKIINGSKVRTTLVIGKYMCDMKQCGGKREW